VEGIVADWGVASWLPAPPLPFPLGLSHP